jgi:hypothetical protein
MKWWPRVELNHHHPDSSEGPEVGLELCQVGAGGLRFGLRKLIPVPREKSLTSTTGFVLPVGAIQWV